MDERRGQAWRAWGAALASACAAALLLRLPLALLRDPHWPQSDAHQARLDEWSARLPVVLARVPPETVLGFMPRGGLDQPLDEAMVNEYERLQAAVAPRRIVARVEADFVLAHATALTELARVAGFEDLPGLEPVVTEWVLVERRKP